MSKRGGLGRGLDALIPDKKPDMTKKIDGEKKSKSLKKSGSSAESAKDSDISVEDAKNVDSEHLFGNEISESADKDKAGEIKVAKNKESSAIDESSPSQRAGETAAQNEGKDGTVIKMRISLVEPNREQPRKYFDEEAIEELADSIRQFGVISPLLVQRKDDYYEIIAGERRWRAAKRAGLKEVPVIVREFSSQEAVEISLIENIQREDLNPIEEAKAYNRLVAEYGLNQEEVAGRVSKSRSAVANSMRLLKLDSEVQKMLETGELSEGHARTLIPLSDGELQKNAADQIVKENLSVRQTEKMVRELMNPEKKQPKSSDPQRDSLFHTLEENLKVSLGTKVSIHQSSRKKGKIEIEYYSDEELDRLYELLRALN